MFFKWRIPTMRHVSRTHRVALGGLFDRNQFRPKSKSNTLTPRTNSQTYWPWEISHVTNGIIFCVCLTLDISVLQIVLKWCRKERKKIQVKKESQQSRSRWWIWSRDAAKGLLMCLLLHQKKAREKKNRHESQFPLNSRTEQHHRTGRPVYTLSHQPTQNGMLIKLGLLKSGNLMNWWKIEQGDLLYSHQHTDRFIVENDKMNSYTEAESEMSLESRSFWHKVNDQVRTRQNQSSKDAKKDSDKHFVIWECLCLLHCKHLYSWRRITQTICIPSKIQEKISQWNRCLTYLKNW